ncbi:MAG: helix-turn-helix domain-containing protein [Chitinivibrionales bacterium]
MYKFLFSVFFLWVVLPAHAADLFDVQKLSWSAFNDSVDSGNSESRELVVSDDQMRWFFSLGDSAAWPYIGIAAIFQLPDTARIDWKSFSGDDTLKVTMRSNRRGPVLIQLCTYDPHITTPDDPVSFRVLQSEVTITTRFQQVSIPLSRFQVAPWWKNRYEVAPEDTNLYLDSICMVEWVFTDTNRIHRTDTLVVQSLGFVRRNRGAWILYAVSVVGVLLLAGAVWWGRYVKKAAGKRSTQATVALLGSAPDDLRPKPVDSEPSEWERIRTYFEDHYRDPQLSLRGCAKTLCFSESKLSRLIRDKHSGGFRSLIHDLRIKEARRLLQETDMHVAEIAHKIGYATASHFNREFKQRQGLTPTEFRKNIDSASSAK